MTLFCRRTTIYGKVIVMKKLTAVILTIIFLLLSVFSAAAENASVDGSNWMSAVDGSVPITAISMPGTHDSATRYASANIISRTQKMSILEQLYSGARYFDMRLKMENKNIIDVHGIINCKTGYGLLAKDLNVSEVVAECKYFLSKNPGETILFLMKDSGSKNKTELYSTFYDEFISKNPDLWFVQNRVPTLDEVRGKIVILRDAEIDFSRFDNSNSGINFMTYPRITSLKTDEFKLCPINSLDGENITYMFVQDSFKVEGRRKKNTIKSFLESGLSKNNFNVCCTNAVNLKLPYTNAKDINSFLMSYDFKKGEYYGIVLMDFITPKLCEKVYMTNSEIMTNTPNKASSEPQFPESYAFLGRTLEFFRNIVLYIASLGV